MFHHTNSNIVFVLRERIDKRLADIHDINRKLATITITTNGTAFDIQHSTPTGGPFDIQNWHQVNLVN